MPDLDTMLQDFASFIEEELPPPDVERLVGAASLRPVRPSRWVRPARVAAIAAVAVLVTIGGPVLLRTLWGDTEPAADETTSTTVVVPSTVPVDIESLIGPATIEGWGRVPHDDAVFGAETAIHDVTGGGPGFVAVGQSGMSAAVWVSTDGRSWSRVPDDPDVFSDGVGAQVAAGGAGLVAVGGSGPTVLTSPDGISWTRLDLVEAGFGNAASLGAVTMGESQFVVGGRKCAPACSVAFWISGDGAAWQEATVDEALEGTNVRQIVPDGSGFVAVGSASGPESSVGAVWVSDDGSRWTRVGASDDVFAAALIETVAAAGEGFLAFGSDSSLGEDGHPVVWTSPDGVTWSRVLLDPDVFQNANVSRVVASGEGFVAVGMDRNGGALWLSPDGLDWERVAIEDGDRGFIEAVVADGPGLVAVGQQWITPDSYVGAVWVLPPEASAPAETTPLPPGPSATESGWARVAIDPALATDGRFYDIAPAGSGLVALGVRGEPDGSRSRLVFTSVDGLAWEIAAVFEAQTIPISIVAEGPSLVIGGRQDFDDGGSDAVFWYSTDGSAWTRVPHDPEVFGDAKVYRIDPGVFGDVTVYRVVATETRILAAGDGWDDEFYGAVTWTSTDGRIWTRTLRPGWELLTVESVDGRFVAIGWEYDSVDTFDVVFWISDDGDAWTEVHREEAGTGFVDFNEAGRRGSELIRVQGAAGSGSMTVWISPDGLTWTRHTATIADVGRLRAISGAESGWVAAGWSLDDVPAVWTSTDGIEWTRVPDDGTVFGQGIGIIDIVPYQSGVVAVGSVTEDDTEYPAGWIWNP